MSFETKCLRAEHNADPTINDKVATRALLQSWGYPTADLIAYVPASTLLRNYLTELVVVKPRNGSTSHGVMALQPAPDGWDDLIAGEHRTWEDIQAFCAFWEAKFPDWTPGYIVETAHMFEGELAREYKPHCFNGIPRLIQGHYIHRGETTHAWWYEGRFVDVGKESKRLDPDYPPPPDGWYELASEIAGRFWWLGFLRVDMFWTDSGWQVGELADHVGNRWFSPEWDRRLGEWWL